MQIDLYNGHKTSGSLAGLAVVLNYNTNDNIMQHKLLFQYN